MWWTKMRKYNICVNFSWETGHDVPLNIHSSIQSLKNKAGKRWQHRWLWTPNSSNDMFSLCVRNTEFYEWKRNKFLTWEFIVVRSEGLLSRLCLLVRFSWWKWRRWTQTRYITIEIKNHHRENWHKCTNQEFDVIALQPIWCQVSSCWDIIFCLLQDVLSRLICWKLERKEKN